MELKQYMLTTIDNPFNPFEDFKNWYNYDEAMGYHTCSWLSRLTYDSSSLSVDEQILEYNRAVEDFIKYDLTGMYIKVEN